LITAERLAGLQGAVPVTGVGVGEAAGAMVRTGEAAAATVGDGASVAGVAMDGPVVEHAASKRPRLNTRREAEAAGACRREVIGTGRILAPDTKTRRLLE
jgi:hypothetical protein